MDNNERTSVCGYLLRPRVGSEQDAVGVEHVPRLVERCLAGELPVDHYVTHQFEANGDVAKATNEAIEALHGGNCLRAVVNY